MINDPPEDVSVGAQLFKQGWRQGTLFRASSASFSWNKLADDAPEPTITPQSRAMTQDQLFIVASQDCDIVAPRHEPYIEALLCSQENNKGALKSLDRNSARSFVISHEHRLIAHAQYKVPFQKEVLLHLTPERWPSNTERLKRFVRWLGRRYTRPALSDDLVDFFQRPVVELIRRLNKEQPELIHVFNGAILELRISLPPTEEFPLEIHPVLLTRSDGLSAAEYAAITAVMNEIDNCLDYERIELHDEDILSANQMTVAQYFATVPIFFDEFTYKGEEVAGEEPLPPL